MSLAEWFEIAGWWTSAVVLYLLVGVLNATVKNQSIDRESRRTIMWILTLFGWVPAGILIIVLGDLF